MVNNNLEEDYRIIMTVPPIYKLHLSYIGHSFNMMKYVSLTQNQL